MNDYYILRNNQPNGPYSLDGLLAMRSRGEISDATHCCREGATAWDAVGSVLGPETAPPLPPSLPALPPQLPASPAVAPGGPHVPGAAAADFAHRVAGKSAEVSGLAGLFARRILASNFTNAAASADERATLLTASTPIEFPIGQNYVAWRRAILWFSGVGLSIAAIFQIGPTFKMLFDGSNPYLALKLIGLALFALQVLAPALTLWAAWQWSEVKDSRRLARFAYFCQLVGPMLIFCIPVAWLVSGSRSELNALKSFYVLLAVEILFPKIFALFPGLIRACLTLRTLLPESPMPGWVCTLIAPLYTLFYMLAVIIAGQAGSLYLFAAFVAFMLAPLFVVLDARRLCAPMIEADMNASLGSLRQRILITTIVGLVLLLISSVDVLKQLNISVSSVINITASLIGNVYLLTLVAADFLTGLMRKAFELDAELHGGPLHATLKERFAQLANVRLADVSAGESMVVRNVSDLMRRARGGDPRSNG